jgi:hypothetical protein
MVWSLRVKVIVQMAVIAGGWLMVSTSAFAQDEPPPAPPPQRDIVLSPTDQSARRQGFVLTAAAFGGFDKLSQPTASSTSRVVTPESATSTQNDLPSGFHSAALGGVEYVRDRDRSSIDLRGQTTTTYFPSLGRRLTTVGVTANVQKQIGARTRLAATPSASYAPYWGLDFFGPLAGAGTVQPLSAQPSGLNSAVVSSPTYRTALDASVFQQISSRTTLVFRGSTQRIELPDRNSKISNQRFGGRLTHALSSQVALNLGYAYWKADYTGTGTGAPLDGHDLDIGANYHKALSFSRNTTFTFGTGSTLFSRGANNASPTQTQDHVDFHMRVDAALDHQIGRTWSARLGYRRRWVFVEGFADPFFVDDVTANVGGMVNGRTTLAASLSYLKGTVGQGTQGSRHRSYGGSTVLRMTLNRSLAAFGQYQYYRFNFSNSAVLPSGFPGFFARNAVRGGLMLVFPPAPPR